MEHVRLPDPRLAIGGRQLDCTTQLAYLGAYQLSIWTIVPELAVELHSGYLATPTAKPSSATSSSNPGQAR